MYYTAIIPCSISTYACNRVLRCTCMQQNNSCLLAVLANGSMTDFFAAAVKHHDIVCFDFHARQVVFCLHVCLWSVCCDLLVNTCISVLHVHNPSAVIPYTCILLSLVTITHASIASSSVNRCFFGFVFVVFFLSLFFLFFSFMFFSTSFCFV
jgi:hypothetical protein